LPQQILRHLNGRGNRRTTSRRLKQLETENARLKKLVVERDLEIEVMKEVAAKNVWSAPSV
jgi:putative transposase